MYFLKFTLLLFIVGTSIANAQVDNISPTYRNISSNKYFRIHYDNDFFTNSDYYYTQGISLELAHPSVSKFFLTKLLIKPNSHEMKYGVALNHFGYTPTSISSNEILDGDRPFAGTLYLKTFATATDNIKHRRITSALNTGIIGPAAGSKQMQTGIHRWLKNIMPKGWQHQVRNDIILNYQLNYEQQLLSFKKVLLLNAAAEVQAGTLKDKLSTGVNFMIGKFNSPYGKSVNSKATKKHVDLYIYGAPQISLVAYDATLQGGVFNRRSPYTIAATDISRITFQTSAGIVLNIGKLNLEYCQSYLTKEYRTGNFHRWAGIKMGFLF